MSEIVKKEDGAMQPKSVIEVAISNGMVDAESLKVLYELQKEERAAQAKAAYDKAMSAFNANPPKIVKDRSVSFKQTSYKHATLSNVVDKIKTALATHGLSLSWRTNHREGGEICVTSIISHELGHSESTTMCAQPDSSGSKNSIQQIGSTVTYLERYTALAITGLAAFDDDAVSAEAISNEMAEHLLAEMESAAGLDVQGFLAWVGVESVEDMNSDQYKTALQGVSDFKKANGGA